MIVETATDDTHLLTSNVEQIKKITNAGIKIVGVAAALTGVIISNPVPGIGGVALLLPRVIDHMVDWLKKGDKEKDLKMVEEHIRLTVDKHRLYLEQEACNVIDDQYEKIFDAVAEYKKEWEAGYEREIQKETQIARFNIQKQKENLEQLLQEAKCI